MIFSKKASGLVVGADYDSVSYALENSYDLIYSHVDYPDVFKYFDMVEEIDSKMMLLSIGGKLHEVKDGSLSIDFDSSFVRIRDGKNIFKIFYDSIYFANDYCVTNKIEKIYDYGWNREAVYSFEIQMGNYKKANVEFDFDSFGFDSLDDAKKTGGKRVSWANKTCLVENERYEIREEKYHYGFRVIDKETGLEYVFFNSHWKKLREWERVRLQRLKGKLFKGGPSTELRSAKKIFNRIYLTYSDSFKGDNPKSLVSDLLEGIIYIPRLKRRVLVYEESVNQANRHKISKCILSQSEKYDNVEVL